MKPSLKFVYGKFVALLDGDQLEPDNTQRFPCRPPVYNTQLIIITTVFVLAAASLNVGVRYTQNVSWLKDKTNTSLHGTLLFSTTDAPYFVGLANQYLNTGIVNDYEARRVYPSRLQAKRADEQTNSIFDWPLLSVLLAELSGSSDWRAILSVGHWLIYATALTTTFMIIFCFGVAGYWIEGTVAAVGGGLSSAYLVRSSFGRIDTDQLNLGFFYFLFGLALYAARSKTSAGAMFGSFIAGLTANLFMWWYGKAELIWLALLALFWLLITLQKNWNTVVSSIAIFLVTTQISVINVFNSPYLKDEIQRGSFIFPNTLGTITEVASISFWQILELSTGSIEIGLIAIVGLIVWSTRQPIVAIAFMPLIFFALLNFLAGNRAVFYSAPILWFGVAYLITTTFRFALLKSGLKGRSTKNNSVAIALGATLCFAVVLVNSPISYVPRPIFSKSVLEGLESLKNNTEPSNSVVATWWDYGYASMMVNKLPVFHDGGSHTTANTHLIAKALLAQDQKKTVSILKYLAANGPDRMLQFDSLDELQSEFEAANIAITPDIYLVLTEQMAGWIGSISSMANWDLKTGTPINIGLDSTNPQLNYHRLECRHHQLPSRIKCQQMNFSIEDGKTSFGSTLNGYSWSVNGITRYSKDYEEASNFALQTVVQDGVLKSQLLSKYLYRSAFNQLFYLNNISDPTISIFFDDYPKMRIFKIEGGG